MRAFLVYIDDWLSSKKIDLMDSGEERGYLRLLLRAATEPDCGLPDDDAQLAVFSKLGTQWFKPTRGKEFRMGSKTSGQKLRDCFFERDGRLYNERLLKEWEYQKEVSEKRSRASAAGNSKRWGKSSQADPSGIPSGSQTESVSNPNDVCVSVCVSSSEVSEEVLKEPKSQFETPGSFPNPPGGTSLKPHPIHNSDWFEFRITGEECGMTGSEPDWDDAFRWHWRTMSLTIKVAAHNGLKDRKGTDDPALKSLPQNYLKQRKWERPVRAPTAINKRDAERDAILERKQRERGEGEHQEGV